MAHSPKKIFVDFERMKYPHTGLYHYSAQLGNALLEAASIEEEFNFYLPVREKDAFRRPYRMVGQNSLHKFFMPFRNRYDLWHATYQGSNYLPATKSPVVLTVHDLNFMHDADKSPEKKAKYLRRLQAHVDKSACIIAISEFTLGEVRQHLRLDGKPARVIYNGCNVAASASPAAPAFVPSKPFLFTVGTVTDKKNFHVLPALLHNNDFQLVIAGIWQSPEYKAKIEAEARKWNASDRVFLTGPVSENDKLWYLQHCAAFAFPSLAEGFGLPVIEAMYFGKPVLLSNLSSLPEVGGDAAYYFPSFEPSEMQQTLAAALTHFASSDQTERAKKRAAQFTWQRAALEHLEVYRSL